jgi:hypothetical protein
MMSLICELAIIASTFIFLRNEIAWQQWLQDAGHSGQSRDKMAMLIFLLVATSCVILLTLVGGGNATIGLNNAWCEERSVLHSCKDKAAKKVTTIVPAV